MSQKTSHSLDLTAGNLHEQHADEIYTRIFDRQAMAQGDHEGAVGTKQYFEMVYQSNVSPDLADLFYGIVHTVFNHVVVIDQPNQVIFSPQHYTYDENNACFTPIRANNPPPNTSAMPPTTMLGSNIYSFPEQQTALTFNGVFELNNRPSSLLKRKDGYVSTSKHNRKAYLRLLENASVDRLGNALKRDARSLLAHDFYAWACMHASKGDTVFQAIVDQLEPGIVDTDVRRSPRKY